MKVIPEVSYVQTANVNVGGFVFLLDGGIEKKLPLAVRSQGDESSPEAQFVIRLDGPSIESLDAHIECLLLKVDLAWKLDVNQITTTSGAPGAAVILPEGPCLVIKKVDRGPRVLAVVLDLETLKCKMLAWGLPRPTLPWSIVDGKDREYARGATPTIGA